jgi:hypothetical protein
MGGRPGNVSQIMRAVTHKASASSFGRRRELEAGMLEY